MMDLINMEIIMQLKFFSAIFLTLFIALLALINTTSVSFSLLFLKINLPLAALIFFFSFLGIIVGIGLGALSELDYKKEIKEKNKEIASLKKEIININADKFGQKPFREITISSKTDFSAIDFSSLKNPDNKDEIEKKVDFIDKENTPSQDYKDPADVATKSAENIPTVKDEVSVITSDERVNTSSYVTTRPKNLPPRKISVSREKPVQERKSTRLKRQTSVLTNFSLFDDYKKFVQEKEKDYPNIMSEYQDSVEEPLELEKKDTSIKPSLKPNQNKPKENITAQKPPTKQKDEKTKATTEKNIPPDLSSIINTLDREDASLDMSDTDLKIDTHVEDDRNFTTKDKTKSTKMQEINDDIASDTIACKTSQPQDLQDTKDVDTVMKNDSNISDRLRAIELGLTDMNQYNEYQNTISQEDEVAEDFVKIDTSAYDIEKVQKNSQDTDIVVKMNECSYKKQLEKSMDYDKTAYTKKLLSPELVKKQFNWGVGGHSSQDNCDVHIKFAEVEPDEEKNKKTGFFSKFFL